MVSFGFKAGIGTASRVATLGDRTFTVGVLVQANFGRRPRLTIGGVPVGRHIPADEIPLPVPPDGVPGVLAPDPPQGAGSVIVVVATDAPLLPHQCERLAQRAALGIGRIGGAGETASGDLMLAFATGNRGLEAPAWGATSPVVEDVRMVADHHLDPLFYAAIEGTEEAVLNAMLAAETMVGRDGVTAHALPVDRLLALLGMQSSAAR
jgi:D-aminopeptidase